MKDTHGREMIVGYKYWDPSERHLLTFKGLINKEVALFSKSSPNQSVWYESVYDEMIGKNVYPFPVRDNNWIHESDIVRQPEEN